jgi:hypothetical protein
MKFSSALAEQGREQSRINAELRRKGALPPLPRMSDYRAAIRGKCVECMGGAFGNGLREDVRTCGSGPASRAPCPLWLYRPWQ